MSLCSLRNTSAEHQQQKSESSNEESEGESEGEVEKGKHRCKIHPNKIATVQVPINRALNGKLSPDIRAKIKQDFRKDVRGYNRVAVLATQHLQMNLKARLEAGNCPTRYSAKLPDGRFDMENGLNIEYYIKAHYHDNFGKSGKRN